MRSRPIIIIINGTRTTTLLAALLLLFFRSAWGDGSGVTKEIAPITNVPQHAYVANQDSPNGTISQYTIGPTGALSPMTPETVTAGKGDSSVAVHPSGHYVYVANDKDATVSHYTIGATGALSPMTPATVATGAFPVSVAVHPSGRYAYVANDKDATVSQYTIGATGALTAMTPAMVAAGGEPFSVAVHPSGRYAYVADFSGNTVSQYTIGATGALSPMTPAKVVAGGNPLSVTVDPSGRYAYVVSQSGGLNAGGAVLQYTVGATGALSPMTPATVAAGTASVAVHPSGRYAYVANRTFKATQYTIGAAGALSPMTPATVAVAAGSPYAVAVDPSGRYAYFAKSVAVDPSGRYAYVANSGDATVSQYTIGATGALSPMTPATVTPEPLAQVKAALLAGSFSKAIDAAARWHAHAPEDADAAQLLAALDEAAGKYRDAAELRKKFPPQASPQPAAPVWLAAGKAAYVGASSLNLRKSASAAAPALVRLVINTPVDVFEVRGEWARVRWAGSPRATQVVLLDPFVDKDSKPKPLRADGRQGPTEGWLAAGFLEPAPLDAAALKAEAARLAQAGKSDEAATLLERAVALGLDDRGTLPALVEAALAAKRWTAAALAGNMLAGTGRPIAPWLEVESSDLIYGCRGDLAKAVLVAPSPADLKAGRAPADACAVNVEPFAPCEPCSGFYDGYEPAEEQRAEFAEKEREYAKAASAFKTRRAELDRLYPPRPLLRLRLRNRQVTSSLPGARFFVYTVNVECDPLTPALGEPSQLIELKVPPLGPQEAAELWIRVPLYAGIEYGVQGEASIDGLPRIRRLTAGGNPCCGCD